MRTSTARALRDLREDLLECKSDTMPMWRVRSTVAKMMLIIDEIAVEYGDSWHMVWEAKLEPLVVELLKDLKVGSNV